MPLARLTQPCLPSPPLLGPSSLWDKDRHGFGLLLGTAGSKRRWLVCEIVQATCVELSLTETLGARPLVTFSPVCPHPGCSPGPWQGRLGLAVTFADRFQLEMPFLGQGEAKWALPALWSSRESSAPGAAAPHTAILWPPTQRARYLVYRPFFLQKEFLTDSRRLLSSRAGKLLSSKLIISPWPRAPDLALFPGWVGWGEMDIRSPTPSL